MHVNVYVCKCARAYVYACVCVCVCVRVRARIHICVGLYSNIYVGRHYIQTRYSERELVGAESLQIPFIVSIAMCKASTAYSRVFPQLNEPVNSKKCL